MAVAAPVLVGLSTGLFPKPQPEPGPAFFGIVFLLVAFVPMVGITVGLRWFFGKPPG
jgi:hypothetical protein